MLIGKKKWVSILINRTVSNWSESGNWFASVDIRVRGQKESGGSSRRSAKGKW